MGDAGVDGVMQAGAGDLARAVIAVHDGTMEYLLLYPEIAPLRAWLIDMLTALLG